MAELDRRLNAYCAEIADIRLKGIVAAERYSEGRLMQVVEPVASLRREPRVDASQETQALMGEKLRVFLVADGWAFAQLLDDSYVGYIRAEEISLLVNEPTHRVAVPSTLLYPAADLKTQPAVPVSLNVALTVTGGDGKYAQLADGRFAFAAHLKSISEHQSDFVAVAEAFLNVPYYWGGKSAAGLDCSGLVQLSLHACGSPCPRDTDMQERELGKPLLVNDLDSLRRGDLIFWRGHVGIMSDAGTLLHANGHHMMTVKEPLREAAARIATPITSIKRL